MNAKTKKKPAELLAELGNRYGLFHTKSGEAFAEVKANGHVEIWPIQSSEFHKKLAYDYYKHFDSVADDRQLGDAIKVLEMKAQFQSEQRDVSLRTIEQGDSILVDLSDSNWRSVEIDQDGWDVVENPVFTRRVGMEPLPEPVQGGSLKSLRRFVNLDDENWVLYQ